MELRTGFGSGGGGRQAAAVVVLCVPCKMVRGGEDLAPAYCESGASAFYLPHPSTYSPKVRRRRHFFLQARWFTRQIGT